MYTILLVKANGDIQEKNVKTLDETAMYKLCNYKTDKAFKHLHTYFGKNKEETFSVSVSYTHLTLTTILRV